MIEDTIETARPQKLGVRYQCTGKIERLSAETFRFIAGDMGELTRNDAYRDTPRGVLEVLVAGAGKYRVRARSAQMVLHYIYGRNTGDANYKGIGDSALPRPEYLEIALPEKSTRAVFRVELQAV